MDYSYYSNFNNYGEGSQQYRTEYTQYYSLWNSSQYYNTNELSPRNYFRDYRRDGGPPEKKAPSLVDAVAAGSRQGPKLEADRDVHTTRTVTRFMLFEETDFKVGTWNEPENPADEFVDTNPETGENPNYTTHFWLKAGQSHGFDDRGQSDGSSKKGKQNKFEKILLDKLSKPVKLSKAESMMQKMGWQGGALGKAGNGIVEPIAPNIAYATKTIGFGQIVEPNVQKSPKNQQPKYKPKAVAPKTKNNMKEDFITNSLHHILQFVKNDWEVQLLFDKKCTAKERKIIHHCVNGFINQDFEEIDNRMNLNITMPAQQDLLDQIQEYNQFILCTESFGEKSERQLCLYKVAPDHVYLITPDDLIDEPDETEPDTKNTESDAQKDKIKDIIDLTDSDKEIDKDQQDESDLKEDENPFLKSITRNLKSDKSDKIDEENDKIVEQKQPEITTVADTDSVADLKEKDSVDSKLLEYFFEFAEQDEYTELRFLGPFTNEENVAISRLLGDIERCINHVVVDRSKVFLSVFESEKYRFEVIDNCNGSSVVHKIEKSLQT